MRAAVIRKYGPPGVFRIEEMPEPEPGPTQVKIKVMASSVNPVDWKIRSGSVAFLSGWRFPKILGGDFSGVVTACGEQVNDFQVGDAVFGLSPAMWKAGAYAEFLCCDAGHLARKPVSLDHLHVAVIPLAGSTAFQALRDCAKLRPGMRLLVTGATGGVGHFAVQLGKITGADVYGVCHSRNAETALALGCAEVLPYDRIDFRKTAQRFDVIFDATAKYGYLSCRASLLPGGTYVSTLPTPALLLGHACSFLPGKCGKFIGVASRNQDLQQLAGYCDNGTLRPLIAQTFPLEQIAEAHLLSETEKTRGKIAVTMF